MTSRRSFITAVLAFLGWRPETPEQKLERLRAKIREAVKTIEFKPPKVAESTDMHVTYQGEKLQLWWPTLGGPDEPD